MDENLALLREGLCPKHGTSLERRGDHGWCEACGIGWSMTPKEVTLHLDVASFEMTTSLGKITARDARMRITRPT